MTRLVLFNPMRRSLNTMSLPVAGRLVAVMCFVVLTVDSAINSGMASAQSMPAIPPLTDERVYVVGVPDRYGALRSEIRNLETQSPQSYYVVVLESAGKGPRATRTYLETLVKRWEDQARRGQASFDRLRSVVIVVDLANRRIIVLGGEELQELYGFRDPYIQRELLAPHFYPHAEAGETERGLRVLVAQIDRWIADRDSEITRRREESAAREARLKGDAQAAQESADRLREETRTKIDERKQDGIILDSLETRFRDASADLDAARQRLEGSPSESLTLSQQGRRAFQEILDELRRVSAVQARNDERLAAEARLAAGVLEAIENADRQDLPIGPVQRDYEAARASIEQARQANRSNPELASRMLDEGERGFREAISHARSLPDLRVRVAELERAVEPIEASARSAFGQAMRMGLADEALSSDWTRAQGLLITAREGASTDLRGSIELYQIVQTSLRTIRDRATGLVDRHRFATRTLPALVLGFVTVLAGTILAWLWYRRRRSQAALHSQFEGFREHAVGLMERLDALRARHGRLADDPKNAEPMTGETLELYQQVEADLNRLWDRWLRVMETWERSQVLARTGSTFRTREFEEARKLLAREGNFEEIRAEVESCVTQMDRLDDAHASATEALEAFRGEGERFHEALELLRAAGLAPTPYREEFDPIAVVAGGAEATLASDPIGAGESLARAREGLAELDDRIGRVRAELEHSEALRRAIEELSTRVAEIRRDGLRLVEEAANPDPRLDESRRLVEQAEGLLQEADPETASLRLADAKSVLEQADAAIQRYLSAREALPREREAIRQEEERLRQASLAANHSLSELEAGYAPKSWQPVAQNLDSARSLLDGAADRLVAADRAASPDVQAYVMALSLLTEVAARQSRADQLLEALADWHRRLVSQAEEVGRMLREIEDELTRVTQFFEQHRDAIGPESISSRTAAEQAYRSLAELSRANRPDWLDLHSRAGSLRRGLAVALQQAESDVEGQRRAADRLVQVRQRARQVETLLARETKDRPPANERFQSAMRQLAELERGALGEAGAWDRRLRQLDEIAANLDRAEEMAGKDIELANVANAEIAKAARVIREARAYYSSGVAADVRPAEAQLNQARGALKSQAYERAIDLANAAEHQMREDFDRAAYAARRRQMSTERGQAFSLTDALAIAAAQAAAHMSGRWLESIRPGGTSWPASGGKPTSGGGGSRSSSGGSWNSGASRGSWTDGADEGRW